MATLTNLTVPGSTLADTGVTILEYALPSNYPLQYVIVGTAFVLGGLIALAFGSRDGAAAVLFGMCGYVFAAVYYWLRPNRW